jgi:hypothetical protein
MKKAYRRILVFSAVVALVAGVFGIRLLVPVGHKITSASGYRLIDQADGVLVEFEERHSYADLEFSIPLSRLGLTAGSVRKVVTTCRCTVAQVGPDDTHIKVTFDPERSKMYASQSLTVIPADPSLPLKKIHLQGVVVPAWYPTPTTIVLNDVRPGEKRLFECTVENKHRFPTVNINSCSMKPPSVSNSVKPRLVEHSKILIEGIVTGSSARSLYKGNIVLELDCGRPYTVRVPVTVTHTGTIIVAPQIVTFGPQTPKEQTVELKSFDGRPLSIKDIRCPPYLTAVPNFSSDGPCLLRISTGRYDLLPKELSVSRIDIFFEGVTEPARIQTVAIPPAD